jgi:hypothetical protein
MQLENTFGDRRRDAVEILYKIGYDEDEKMSIMESFDLAGYLRWHFPL